MVLQLLEGYQGHRDRSLCSIRQTDKVLLEVDMPLDALFGHGADVMGICVMNVDGGRHIRRLKNSRLRPDPKAGRLSSRAHVAHNGWWRSLVAHLTGGQGVAGSNPVHPTTKPQVRGLSLWPFFLYVLFDVLFTYCKPCPSFLLKSIFVFSLAVRNCSVNGRGTRLRARSSHQ